MEKFKQATSEPEDVDKIKPAGIIAGSPGVGKSTFFENLSDDISVSDMDPSPYREAEDWPENYINAIIVGTEKTNLVLVGTHPEIIQTLIRKGFEVTVVCPDESLKEEYKERYIARGNKPEIIDRIMAKAFKTNDESLADFEGCRVVFLKSGQYLSDVVDLS